MKTFRLCTSKGDRVEMFMEFDNKMERELIANALCKYQKSVGNKICYETKGKEHSRLWSFEDSALYVVPERYCDQVVQLITGLIS